MVHPYAAELYNTYIFIQKKAMFLFSYVMSANREQASASMPLAVASDGVEVQ